MEDNQTTNLSLKNLETIIGMISSLTQSFEELRTLASGDSRILALHEHMIYALVRDLTKLEQVLNALKEDIIQMKEDPMYEERFRGIEAEILNINNEIHLIRSMMPERHD